MHSFDHHHYVPVLKAKAGELDAICKSARLRKSFTPLIEIPPIPLSYPEGIAEPIPAKTIDVHVGDVANKLVETFEDDGEPIFLDGAYTEEDTLADCTEPIGRVYQTLNEGGIPFIPVVGLDSVVEYATAVKQSIANDGRGGCIRVRESDLEGSADVSKQISSLLKFLGINAKKMHLIIDFGSQIPSKTALPYQLAALPLIEDWRSLTVTSTSIPIDLSEVPKNSLGAFERKEWRVWNQLRANADRLQRMPSYGDYAVNHPQLIELDPKIMMMSPNIRYTGTTSFIIAKGRAIPRKKKRTPENANLLPGDQYPKLSQAIMKNEEWMGPKFSAGDLFIKQCSEKKCTGNATNWRSVGTSHHLAFVVQQLANLPSLG